MTTTSEGFVSTKGPVLSEPEARAVRRGVPDPGIRLAAVSIPTVALWFASLVLWLFATWLVLFTDTTAWVTVPLHAIVTFTMFTVLHESTHHAVGRPTWVNELFGRLSIPFVASYASFPLVRFIHIEHHRNTNEAMTSDPDAWTSHGRWWQLPIRWASLDVWYILFYLRSALDWRALATAARTGFRGEHAAIARRPHREIAESFVLLFLSIAVFTALIVSGYGWYVAVIYFIPQRIGLAVLAWWFDWLPHHGLPDTAARNRFHATRMRMGLEWLLTPIMLYQNYHLVHHLHPAIPFYRYAQAWKNNEQAYLDQDVPLSTVWGRELTVSEYRAWRRLTASLQSDSSRAQSAAGRASFHPLTVTEVRPLTADAVSITFDLPEHLREEFMFVPGQHLTVRLVDGEELRRTYSICTSAASGVLRIAVKHIADGVVSGYLNRELAAGDVLDVMPPAGRFTLTPVAGTHAHYVGVAAGSGITPIISMLATALSVDEKARFTLLYGNRTAESTMFGDELDMLTRQFDGRLRVVHFRSAERDRAVQGSAATVPTYQRLVHGRITAEQLAELMGSADIDQAAVTAWYLCGPQPMIDDLTGLFDSRGVDAATVHRELFHADSARSDVERDMASVAATISATAQGESCSTQGFGHESVLESVLREGLDAPYGCMGGACGTCRAKIIRGAVEMDINYALTKEEVHAGYVLTCQSRPTTPLLDVDYDQ